MRQTLSYAALLVLLTAPLTAQQPAPPPQPPAGPNNGVQVAVPQGNAADQARDQERATAQQRERARIAAQPLPRYADGHVMIGSGTGVKGVWIAGNLGVQNPPYQPWTKAVSEDRRRMQLEPHTRCKASGGPRQFLTPYGAEFVEIRELRRAYIFDIGGPHTYRTIYMDGRKHPEKLTPEYYGHSIGWWEGDTLVVDTVGFNEDFWIDRGQLPHTTQLHLVEKFTRTAFDTMRYEVIIEDPGAYTAPFSGVSNLRWENGTELFEYICQQENYAGSLMVGADKTEGTVDRTSLIVP